MKFKILLKDPDGIYDSQQVAVNQCLREVEDEDEREVLRDVWNEKISEIVGQWCQYGDYFCIEIDTAENTASLCKTSEY